MDRPALDPLHDVILLLPDETTEATGGFLLREEATSELRSGVVVAHGPGRWSEHRGERTPVDVEVGQRVLVPLKAGIEVRDGDVAYLAVSGRDVLFVDRRDR